MSQNDINVNIKEIEVLRVNPQPGDVLIFKLIGDEMDEEVTEVLRQNLKKAFPNNKVGIIGLPFNHDVQLTVVGNQGTVGNDCAKPDSYCIDCSCGKKQKLEGV